MIGIRAMKKKLQGTHDVFLEINKTDWDILSKAIGMQLIGILTEPIIDAAKGPHVVTRLHFRQIKSCP